MSGHVFVVQADMANLDCDVVVVPTDIAFAVEPYWDAVLGTDTAEARGRLRPEGWARRRSGRAAESGGRTPRPTWFVDAVSYSSPASDLAAMIERLRQSLRDIATAGIEPAGARSSLLVAVPTLGTRGGGFGPVRGKVVADLLAACDEECVRAGIDVVLVARSRADYTAFQERRREEDFHSRHLDTAVLDHARHLGERARAGELALFIGAGASMSVGLPSWSSLLESLLEEAADGNPDVAALDLGGVGSALDRAELLARLVPRKELGEAVARLTRADRYGITHALLAGLRTRQMVTTNYDDLLERAAADVIGPNRLAVLPFDTMPARDPWLLKMHGDSAHPESIVLTRSDFVSYDANSRPMGSIVQSLLITRHLVLVGTSLTDDNVLRLALEVMAFRDAKGKAVAVDAAPGGVEPLGTVLAMRDDAAQRLLWSGRLDHVAVSRAGDDRSRARDLAIFLDAVAMFASANEYVADERYENLLSEDEVDLARAARDALARIAALPEAARPRWAELQRALERLGAG